jgi:peptidoglycan/xylan/chitin deacetylase (PgdA/CDA1 family)
VNRALVVAIPVCLVLACSSDHAPGKPPTTPEGGAGGGAPNGGTSGTPGAGGAQPGTGGGSGTGGGGGASGSSGTSGSGGATTGRDGGADSGTPARDGAADVTPGPFRLDGVASWRGNATAAYSIIHDDLCDPSTNGSFTHADPELVKRGLHAGFGAIVNQCQTISGTWNKVKTLVSHGHDIFSHSWTHSCIGSASECEGNGMVTNDLAKELEQADRVLEMQLGITVEYFIFPFDVCGASAVARLKQLGYLGARCGDHGINAPSFPDGFVEKFDIWGPNFSLYGETGPCMGHIKPDDDTPPSKANPADCRLYTLNQYVEDAIRMKGWANRELHGFDPDDINEGAFQPITVADYTTHLDFLKMKVDMGQLWVEGPTRVLRYRFARERCAPPTIDGSRLHFAAPSADCQRVATPVTYLISTTDMSDPPTLRVQQGADTLPTKKLSPGHFAVDADPTKGDATLIR